MVTLTIKYSNIVERSQGAWNMEILYEQCVNILWPMWLVTWCMKRGNIVWTMCQYFIANVTVQDLCRCWEVTGCMKHGNIVWTMCCYFIANVTLWDWSHWWEVTRCTKHGNIVCTVCPYFIANVTGHMVHETWTYCINNVSIFHSQCDCSGWVAVGGHKIHKTWKYCMVTFTITYSNIV